MPPVNPFKMVQEIAASPPELRLKRLIHLGVEAPTYMPGRMFKSELVEEINMIGSSAIDSFVKDGKEKDVTNIILKAFTDGYSVYPEALVFAIALAARQKTSEKLRESAYIAARTVCATPENLFAFISYTCQLAPGKGVGQGVKKLVRDWYMNREPMELLKLVLECKAAYGWKHKDIITLTHINAKSKPGNYAVVTYLMKGLDKMKLECGEMPEAKPVIAYLEGLAMFKTQDSTNSAEAIKLIHAHDYPMNQISSLEVRHKWVWREYIPKLPLPFLLASIHRLGHMRFLNEEHPIAHMVIKALGDPDSIAKSNLHPAEVLIVLKKYEDITNISKEVKKKVPNHTKPQNQLPLCVNNKIVEALNLLMTSTFKLLVPTGLRYLVVVDVREEMSTGHCYQNNLITPLLAASLMTLSLVKTERSVLVGTYGNANSVQSVRVGHNATLQETHDKLRATAANPVDLSQPINWAKHKGKEFDVFVLITSNQVRQENLMSPAKAMQQYRKKMKRPLAKLVVCALSCMNPFGVADPHDPGMFEIAGFNGKVPRTIEAFSRGAF